MMNINERAGAIRRAKRALKTLTAANPDTRPQQLDAARDRLNNCYRLTDPAQVWEAVNDIENLAAEVYGVPDGDEPAQRAVRTWVSPRGRPRPAKPRRPRRVPRN